MNRAAVFERLVMIQERLAVLIKLVHADKLHEVPTLTQIIEQEVRPTDDVIAGLVGWLAGYASHAGFENDLVRLLEVLEIERSDIEAIETGTHAVNGLALDQLAKALYDGFKSSIMTVIAEKLSRSDAIIIRTKDAKLIDEFARNGTAGALAALGDLTGNKPSAELIRAFGAALDRAMR